MPRDEGGYLLIEVFVTSALLLMALLAIMPLYSYAARQNAFAKDMSVASALAIDKVEEFNAINCSYIRRGTCCHMSADGEPSLDEGDCRADQWTVDGITYNRTCNIRRNVTDDGYDDDSDDTDYSWPVEGMAWIEVTVSPGRGSHFGTQRVRPAVVSAWRYCDPCEGYDGVPPCPGED